MKRAAIVLLMVTALVVLVSPSGLLPDVSSCYASPSKSTAGPAAIRTADGGAVEPGGNSHGGGTNEGDADGLSGMGSGGSGKVMIEQGLAPGQRVDRVMILVGTWWRFMIWMR
jgi:hypothetical protein